MKISHDKEADALYIRLLEGEYESRVVRLGENHGGHWSRIFICHYGFAALIFYPRCPPMLFGETGLALDI